MTVFRTRATIGEDHRLVIELPEDLPCGPADITVEVAAEASAVDNAERRRKAFAAVGALSHVDGSVGDSLKERHEVEREHEERRGW